MEWFELSPSDGLEAQRLWLPWFQRTLLDNFKQAMGEHWIVSSFLIPPARPRAILWSLRWPGRMTGILLILDPTAASIAPPGSATPIGQKTNERKALDGDSCILFRTFYPASLSRHTRT
jgi:hypothetical protein